MTDAPGWPGIAPRWTSSAKSGVGTALSPVSRVWFTLSHGILDEIYYPRVDQACTRDFGLIVTDGDGFFAEEKRDCSFELTRLEDGVPAFRLVNTHLGGRFRITKDVLTDQRADVVLQRIRLEVLSGPPLRCSHCSHHIWSMAGRTTPPGSATTRAIACCLPRATAPVSRLAAHDRSSPPRSASSVPATAGRCCTPTAA